MPPACMSEALSLQRRPLEAHQKIPPGSQTGARADPPPGGRAAHLAEERPRQEDVAAGGRLRPNFPSSRLSGDGGNGRYIGRGPCGRDSLGCCANHNHARARSEQVLLPASPPTSGEAVRTEGRRVGEDFVGGIGCSERGRN